MFENIGMKVILLITYV